MLAAANSFFPERCCAGWPVDPGAGEHLGSDGVTTIVKWIAWIVFALAVIGVLVTAGAMMINNRHRVRGGEHAASLGWVFGGCILASAASGLVGMFMG